MNATNGGYMPVDQARLLLQIERAEARAQLRRERIVCLGSVLIMGVALVMVCWWAR